MSQEIVKKETVQLVSPERKAEVIRETMADGERVYKCPKPLNHIEVNFHTYELSDYLGGVLNGFSDLLSMLKPDEHIANIFQIVYDEAARQIEELEIIIERDIGKLKCDVSCNDAIYRNRKIFGVFFERI